MREARQKGAADTVALIPLLSQDPMSSPLVEAWLWTMRVAASWITTDPSVLKRPPPSPGLPTALLCVIVSSLRVMVAVLAIS